MTIPETIPIASIDVGVRGRSQLSGIEELAESIETNGLIQPIVLALEVQVSTNFDGESECETYALVAGGRRLAALRTLGVIELHHAVTSSPGRYGFLLSYEINSPLSNLLLEIAENRDRDDVDWRDEVKMIVRAARLIQGSAEKRILQRHLGGMIGVPYHDVDVAILVHDDLVANPQDYKAVTGLRAAEAVLLRKNQQFLEKELVTWSSKVRAQVGPKHKFTLETEAGAVIGEEIVQPIVIPLSRHLFHRDGLRFMFEESPKFDHIICDPDFGLSLDRLSAKGNETGIADGSGVAQKSVDDSLRELQAFIELSFNALKERGFLVFFYDLDHHKTIQTWLLAAGFAAQRWPITWHKTDYRSNASPQCNTTKDCEWICVARKAGSVLAQPDKSIWSLPGEFAYKDFGHPFAKPRALWQRIFNLVATKGQTIFDPFAGAGSSVVSAIEWGLEAVACEIQEVHFNSMRLNVEKTYRKMVGEHVKFE